MNILVTGAGGLIGKNVCESLKGLHNVIRTDINNDYIKLDQQILNIFQVNEFPLQMN